MHGVRGTVFLDSQERGLSVGHLSMLVFLSGDTERGQTTIL